MSTKTKNSDKNGSGAKKEVSVWTRAVTGKSEWPDKEEFLDVIYWLRQALGFFLGILWGVIPLQGFLGLALFVLINAGLLYVYFNNFQCIEEEEFGGPWELTKEGFMTSFAGFLVMWIIVYTGLYYDPEQSS
ncbi:respirasome Complex Assembly Factor 1 [Anthonomus grandis grandis]|uniref:respirasome Complex Assembly Factor 1 n=1 Tax=Anthonomus grandis grandis TaxID=2921223 RepID=UPI0021659F1C|nr:respirasome Complex Assembly Factor 1 [Anthonomus grandis grandis]